MCEVYLNDEYNDSWKTSTKKKADAPVWNERFELFVNDLQSKKLNVVIKEQKDAKLGGPAVLGSLSLPLVSILDQLGKEQWLVLKQGDGAEVKLNFEFRHLPGLSSKDQVRQNGILELEIVSAENLMAADLGGKMKNRKSFRYK
jgi:Ca2+-dependent lipid-binding protein